MTIELTWFEPDARARLTRKRANIIRFASSGPFVFEIRRQGDRAVKAIISRPLAPGLSVVERDFDLEAAAIDWCNAYARACAEVGHIAALDRVSTLMAPRDPTKRSPRDRQMHRRA